MRQQKKHGKVFYRSMLLLDRVDHRSYPLIMAPSIAHYVSSALKGH
jgi:hypothetical protein